MTDSWIELGVVLKPHGVRGAVRVQLHNETSRATFDGDLCLNTDAGASFLCRVIARPPGALVVQCGRIADREGAELLRGARLMIAKEDVPVAADEVLYSDLIGCRAFDGEALVGDVVRVFHSGASDVIVLRASDRELMVPYVDAFVLKVDVDARRVSLRDTDQLLWQAAD